MEVVYILSIVTVMVTPLPGLAAPGTTNCQLWEKLPGKHQTTNPIQTSRFRHVTECQEFCERLPTCAAFDSSTLGTRVTCFFYPREGPMSEGSSYTHWRKNPKCQLGRKPAAGNVTETQGIPVAQHNVKAVTPSKPKEGKIPAKCYPGVWVSTPGVRAKIGTLLNTVPASTVDKLCKQRCLASTKCITLDTISSTDGTQCFASDGQSGLEKKLNYIHWEYQTRCKTASGKAFLFKYLGSYTISSGKNYTNTPNVSQLSCVGLCAASSSCRVVAYNKHTCYQIPNLQEALHAKWPDKGAQMFEKTELRHRSLVNGVPPDYCIPEKLTAGSPINSNNNTWERPQICWLGISNQTCTFSYAGPYMLKNTSDLPKPVLVTNRTQCLLQCSESPTCAVAAYSDTTCILADRTTVSRIPRIPAPTWTQYYKDSCRIPTVGAATPTTGTPLTGLLITAVLMAGTTRLWF